VLLLKIKCPVCKELFGHEVTTKALKGIGPGGDEVLVCQTCMAMFRPGSVSVVEK
jgi:hypothetical protein